MTAARQLQQREVLAASQMTFAAVDRELGGVMLASPQYEREDERMAMGKQVRLSFSMGLRRGRPGGVRQEGRNICVGKAARARHTADMQ